VATKSKYLLKVHNLVRQQDLPELTAELQRDFQEICNTAFTEDPYGCFGLPSHDLRGDLRHYRALEIDYNGVSFRLVYRVYESPTPKRVQVISFAEHDLAYERAKERC
jgi:mRNA interferase RelE/StbE